MSECQALEEEAGDLFVYSGDHKDAVQGEAEDGRIWGDADYGQLVSFLILENDDKNQI